MTSEVRESVFIDADPTAVYEAISAVKPLTRWSPEFIGARLHGPVREGTRFTGFNRRRGRIWFTTARITEAVPGREFTFVVSTFGMPVAEWGFTLRPDGDGTVVTQHWRDLRTGRSAPAAKALGLVFTGVRPGNRGVVNTAGMRTTLDAMSADLGRQA